ncbi:MAG: hypothetical protein CLLPBCKN_008170 [Chroococcidiopsis cubana SAG 39.79]|uniref:tetratricopeptide repeat protein n=1 Tax=Chroococcidiopsis cubana TaxID=171392 RepID=UPI002AC73B6F|nr:tetratricopeptide repeat protein [Chroococcidiopsis cubana]MDZ4878733.1 hypothetical protein [Chroococcidiopsis cubana SAG 39.79]
MQEGQRLMDTGKLPAAIAKYQQAAKISPKNARIYSTMGYIQALQKTILLLLSPIVLADRGCSQSCRFSLCFRLLSRTVRDNAGAAALTVRDRTRSQ